ncbi:MAG TPA: glutathione S-transferase family protein [Rhizomicrobium sp.]|nr:glutathione S-transferase family protein [Rhizomicrobium sp.]
MGLILYGANLSPFVRKVRVVLAEKAIPYAQEQINPFRPPPDFEALSPLKRIPVLRDSDWPAGMTLPDSSVICDYLENIHPEPALFPKVALERARALWFEEYVDGGMFPLMGPDLFFQRIVKKFLRQTPDEELCREAVGKILPPYFDYLEREIGDRQFLAGDMFSIADISVASVMVNFVHAGESLDRNRWPKFAAYVARLHARPSFAAIIAEEMPLIELARSR